MTTKVLINRVEIPSLHKIYVIPMPECELPTTISLSSLTFFNQIINIILEYI